MATEQVVNEKVSRLIVNLRDRTLEGKVKWERTVSKDRFSASFYPYAVTIKRFPIDAMYTSHAYSLDMLTLAEGQVDELRIEDSPGQGDYDTLHEIFALAQNLPEHVEKGLDRLLQELESR